MLAVPHKNTAPPQRIAHAIASGLTANFIVAPPMIGCVAPIGVSHLDVPETATSSVFSTVNSIRSFYYLSYLGCFLCALLV